MTSTFFLFTIVFNPSPGGDNCTIKILKTLSITGKKRQNLVIGSGFKLIYLIVCKKFWINYSEIDCLLKITQKKKNGFLSFSFSFLNEDL